ncbi:helix-turn-helix domain-containing protein [Clostridium intestinale]|uniref:Helix-turn-helix domain-containing protein n=1 Tax=Clostridium intestinale TaxID=36845 RepID=A0A7D6ZX72_9CLOT|nr:helix-turn-helix domain-containing protein [Clostridium intestinale]QLY77835.1 helix-turn-helix domain-containing protein [Clostridium intestinale]
MSRTAIKPKEVAERWDIEQSTVYKLVKEGILRTVSGIGAVRILLEDIEYHEANMSENTKDYLKKAASYSERKKDKKINELEEELQRLKSEFAQIHSITTSTIFRLKEGM